MKKLKNIFSSQSTLSLQKEINQNELNKLNATAIIQKTRKKIVFEIKIISS